MERGQKAGAEQVVLELRQIEVQTTQGMSLALACKEAEISEQSSKMRCRRASTVSFSRAVRVGKSKAECEQAVLLADSPHTR